MKKKLKLKNSFNTNIKNGGFSKAKLREICMYVAQLYLWSRKISF